LFNPSLSSAEHRDDDIVKVGKDTFFRDMSLFLKLANEAAIINNAKIVRRYLHVYLRGDAQEWYISILTPIERQKLRDGSGISY